MILLVVIVVLSFIFAILMHIDAKISNNPKKVSDFRAAITGAILGFLIAAVYIRMNP